MMSTAPATALLIAVLLPGGPAPAPSFPSSKPADWIGAPVTWDGLKGRVVLMEVWTFG
jgi:hypothetical protein